MSNLYTLLQVHYLWLFLFTHSNWFRIKLFTPANWIRERNQYWSYCKIRYSFNWTSGTVIKI